MCPPLSAAAAAASRVTVTVASVAKPVPVPVTIQDPIAHSANLSQSVPDRDSAGLRLTVGRGTAWVRRLTT